MAEEMLCSCCKKKIANLEGTTKFMCPGCGKVQIIRCGHCRNIVAKYKCHGCGFEGPN